MIFQNSSIGSPVFRVVASDPDDSNSPEGQLKFSFLQDGADSLAFKIGMLSLFFVSFSKMYFSLILVCLSSACYANKPKVCSSITVNPAKDPEKLPEQI